MPRKASGEEKVRIFKQKQKNGDTYVIERREIYDSVKKYNVSLGDKLLGKIPKGGTLMVRTRPKRKSQKEKSNTVEVAATRRRAGMTDIMEAIGRKSGVDDAVRKASGEDTGKAEKIISLARYMLASEGDALEDLSVWQAMHETPYREGLSEDSAHDLMKRVGADESLQQAFFLERAKRLPPNPAIAYDSTTVSTYGDLDGEARQGFNKNGDGLDTVKLLTLYAEEEREPICFTKRPGNLTDVSSVKAAIKELHALGIEGPEFVLDNGYYSEENIAELSRDGIDIVMLVKTNLTWVKAEILKRTEDLDDFASVCPFDPSVHGVTVRVEHTFMGRRKNACAKKGLQKGDPMPVTREVYLHIFFNRGRENDEIILFEKKLLEVKRLLEAGVPLDELSDEAREMAEECFRIRRYRGRVIVEPVEEAIREARGLSGYFVVMTTREKDTFHALRKYRKRVFVEDFFKGFKDRVGGKRPRVWDSTTFRGRLFIEFVALSYREWYAGRIRDAEAALEEDIRRKALGSRELRTAEKLLSWMRNTSLTGQLHWFDVVENVGIETRWAKERFSTEMTERDRMYLDRLGLVAPHEF